jgi:hypothetical protein
MPACPRGGAGGPAAAGPEPALRGRAGRDKWTRRESGEGESFLQLAMSESTAFTPARARRILFAAAAKAVQHSVTEQP